MSVLVLWTAHPDTSVGTTRTPCTDARSPFIISASSCNGQNLAGELPLPLCHPQSLTLSASLDDFISDRLGGHHTANDGPSSPSGPRETRSARIRAFRAARAGAQAGQPAAQRKRDPAWRTVHLTSAEEAASLLRDIVEGLGFLVSHQTRYMHSWQC